MCLLRVLIGYRAGRNRSEGSGGELDPILALPQDDSTRQISNLLPLTAIFGFSGTSL